MPLSHAQLRSFHAVATEGSFTKAAQALHITQPTLSGQVKALEQRYGVKLFHRHGRHIELTDLGRSVLAITRRLFDYAEQAEQLLLSARGLTPGHLRVGADSPYIITPLLARFRRRYPGIEISIQYGNSEQVMQWLRSGACDIAVVPNVPFDDARLHTLKLTADQLVLFVSGEHPWCAKRSVALEELAGQRVILRETGSRTRAIFQRALSQCGVELPDTIEIGSREGVREAVAAGFGVGVVSESELGGDLRFRTLKVSNADLTHAEFAVCRKQARALRVTGAFLELVAAHIDSESTPGRRGPAAQARAQGV